MAGMVNPTTTLVAAHCQKFCVMALSKLPPTNVAKQRKNESLRPNLKWTIANTWLNMNYEYFFIVFFFGWEVGKASCLPICTVFILVRVALIRFKLFGGVPFF